MDLVYGHVLSVCDGPSISLYQEYGYNPALNLNGSMEGKEVRFGMANQRAVVCSDDQRFEWFVNAMHDSLSPISGLIAMFNIMLER